MLGFAERSELILILPSNFALETYDAGLDMLDLAQYVAICLVVFEQI